MSQHAEGSSARGGRGSRTPRQNHGGDKSATGGVITYEAMRENFPGLQPAEFEQAKLKHGNDVEALVTALSADSDGWNTVKDPKKKESDAEKSKAVKGRDVPATAAAGQPRPEGFSRPPNNGAGRGVPRPPRPADASPREAKASRADAPGRPPRDAEAKPANAPDARPSPRTPRQTTEPPKAAAPAPVVVKPAAATVNKWLENAPLAQQEKDKAAALARANLELAKAQEAARKADELSERQKQQQSITISKQQQQREAPVAPPKQSSTPTAVASPKATAPAPAPVAAAPAAITGGFKMNFQNPAALNPSAELQFGDMALSESAQSSAAFQPQEQASGYASTFNAAEGQAPSSGDGASLNGTFIQGQAGGPRYQHQQAKPASQQHMPHHQMSPYPAGFWNPQMMYMGNHPSMYPHMGMPMMPYGFPQGYPQQGMYGQQPHGGNYSNRHGKNQSHNSQSTHAGAQHSGGVAPAHHYQQQQPSYPASFPAAEGQEGSLDAAQQQHKEVPQQQPYYQGYSQWQGKAAGKPNAGMAGHHDYSAYAAQPAYWPTGAQQFVSQQQQQQQQHVNSAATPAWTGHN